MRAVAEARGRSRGRGRWHMDRTPVFANVNVKIFSKLNKTQIVHLIYQSKQEN